jgi:hypothetical protein
MCRNYRHIEDASTNFRTRRLKKDERLAHRTERQREIKIMKNERQTEEILTDEMKY